jgi:RimJ/RimL family protein N-acetyltransferase
MFFGEVAAADFDAVADALGDSPFTVISTHLLRRRWCRTWVAGTPQHFDALVLHHIHDPSEPCSFGEDAEAIWRLLQHVQGWTCIESSPSVAPALGHLIEQHLHVPVRYLQDIHHTLTQPAPDLPHPNVRLLTPNDLPLIYAAQPNAPREQIEWILREGAIAGAIVNDELVAWAQTYAIAGKHCDIGVFTHEAHRRRGYSAACAALVAKAMLQRNLIPVWSTGETNTASRAVARKIGFREVGRLVYAIPKQAFTTENTERSEISHV